MATITRTPSSAWKAIIRKPGCLTTSKSLRTKRDAQDWARQREDLMVGGAYTDRVPSGSTTLKSALKRYLAEAFPTKNTGTQRRKPTRAIHFDSACD